MFALRDMEGFAIGDMKNVYDYLMRTGMQSSVDRNKTTKESLDFSTTLVSLR
jgi:hypothetical protein